MKILLAGHPPLLPAIAGNRQRMFTLLNELKAMGHDVHFCHIAAEAGDTAGMRDLLGERFYHFPYSDLLTPSKQRPLWNELRAVRVYNRLAALLGLRRLDFRHRSWRRTVDDWYDANLTEFLKRLQGEHSFEAVIIAYAFQSKAFEAFPSSVLRILDTVEKFAGRWRHGEYYCSTHGERLALRRADRVLAIQEREAAHFRSLVSPKNVFVVGHIVETPAAPSVTDDNRNVLFLGSANEANRDGIHFFVETIWPQVLRSIPEARLRVAGGVSQHVPDAPGVEKLGIVPKSETVLREAAVVLCPLRFGTGLKIKVAEALAVGKAVVATKVGAEGLEEGADRAILIADESTEFAARVIDILQKPAQRRALEQGAREFIAELNRASRTHLTAALMR